MVSGSLSLFLAGDSLITRPWSHIGEAEFLALIAEIRAADVSITNLETVIHEFRGYAQADSGGVYMASPPEVARELRWAGFDMVAHANNHTFDYGSTGVLETIEHVERAGLVLAGSGKDLQSAREPRFVQCDGRTVALVAMASDFVPYGRASRSRADVPGRPGLNPLTLSGKSPGLLLPKGRKRSRQLLRKLGVPVHAGDHYGIMTGYRIDPRDLTANLETIAAASTRADLVVASIHAHRQGRWLERVAREAIEHGAAVVFVHGPHKVKGIEMYRGRPIFYSLGDFVYETDYIERYPAEAYEGRGLSPDAVLDEMTAVRLQVAMLNTRATFEGFAASLSFSASELREIRIIPVDLQFDGTAGTRGRPRVAAPALGREIVGRVMTLSKALGTRIDYDEGTNRGVIAVAGVR